MRARVGEGLDPGLDVTEACVKRRELLAQAHDANVDLGATSASEVSLGGVDQAKTQPPCWCDGSTDSMPK